MEADKYYSKETSKYEMYWKCNIPIDSLEEGQYKVRVDFTYINNKVKS